MATTRMFYGISEVPTVPSEVLRADLEEMMPGGQPRCWTDGAQAAAVWHMCSAIRQELSKRAVAA